MLAFWNSLGQPLHVIVCCALAVGAIAGLTWASKKYATNKVLSALTAALLSSVYKLSALDFALLKADAADGSLGATEKAILDKWLNAALPWLQLNPVAAPLLLTLGVIDPMWKSQIESHVCAMLNKGVLYMLAKESPVAAAAGSQTAPVGVSVQSAGVAEAAGSGTTTVGTKI